jgi:hypothetical protein
VEALAAGSRPAAGGRPASSQKASRDQAHALQGVDDRAGHVEAGLAVISTMQVGLVTLISVSRSPITSRPTMSRPRAHRMGPGVRRWRARRR